MKKNRDGKDSENLFKILSSLNGEEEFRLFFEDLCTFKEIELMAQRVRCAEYLLKGETYIQIMEKTAISSATLCRISRCIQHGSGGYNKLLAKMLED